MQRDLLHEKRRGRDQALRLFELLPAEVLAERHPGDGYGNPAQVRGRPVEKYGELGHTRCSPLRVTVVEVMRDGAVETLAMRVGEGSRLAGCGHTSGCDQAEPFLSAMLMIRGITCVVDSCFDPPRSADRRSTPHRQPEPEKLEERGTVALRCGTDWRDPSN